MNEQELIEKIQLEAFDEIEPIENDHDKMWELINKHLEKAVKAGQKEATETIQQILLIDVSCASGELTHLANDKKLYDYITSFRFKGGNNNEKKTENKN